MNQQTTVIQDVKKNYRLTKLNGKFKSFDEADKRSHELQAKRRQAAAELEGLKSEHSEYVAMGKDPEKLIQKIERKQTEIDGLDGAIESIGLVMPALRKQKSIEEA